MANVTHIMSARMIDNVSELCVRVLFSLINIAVNHVNCVQHLMVAQFKLNMF